MKAVTQFLLIGLFGSLFTLSAQADQRQNRGQGFHSNQARFSKCARCGVSHRIRRVIIGYDRFGSARYAYRRAGACSCNNSRFGRRTTHFQRQKIRFIQNRRSCNVRRRF